MKRFANKPQPVQRAPLWLVVLFWSFAVAFCLAMLGVPASAEPCNVAQAGIPPYAACQVEVTTMPPVTFSGTVTTDNEGVEDRVTQLMEMTHGLSAFLFIAMCYFALTSTVTAFMLFVMVRRG